MRFRIMLSELNQECLRRVHERPQILRVEGAVLVQPLLIDLTARRINPFRRIKCAAVIRAQIDDHRIRLPGGEVIR
ncbi:hypothetical protein D3C73_1021200 [compost metagenome]